MTSPASLPERAAIEDFLYREAELLDTWRLVEWAELFTDDGTYLIPATDTPDGEPHNTLFLVYDDRQRLTERAKRLTKKTAHAEFPHSKTRRSISNVRVARGADGAVQVSCNFVVHRSRGAKMDIFPGHSLYAIVPDETGGFRIRSKRATLDIDALRPQGKLSIIL
jgi:p-cumate 2,3-dioxygenase beta subunit